MSRLEELFEIFRDVAEHPKAQLEKYIAQGKKVIGCFPYYVPEEIVVATGMVPFGVWGGTSKTISKAKEYFASFYCSLAQLNLEMGLNGTLDKLSGVIVTSMCDTLRPLSQNFRVGVPQIPYMFLAHGQNRKIEAGVKYTHAIFTKLKEELEAIAGRKATDEDFRKAFEIFNESRKERRRFVSLVKDHADLVSTVNRSKVLKSAYFMEKEEHTALLKELNDILEASPVKKWKGAKIVTSGIMVENQRLLEILDENKVCIVADDVAHESRAIRVDVNLDIQDPMEALARQFADQDDDPLLYDPLLDKRPEHVVNLAKNNGANGVIIFMMNFCDPEEMEFPSLKKALEQAGIPMIKIGIDLQMTDFGQAQTSIQAFSDVVSL